MNVKLVRHKVVFVVLLPPRVKTEKCENQKQK